MGRISLIVVAGVALFLGGIWATGLWHDLFKKDLPTINRSGEVVVRDLQDLGPDLYHADPFKDIPGATRPAVDQIVFPGVMVPTETEEVSSLVNGRVLFIGEQVDDSAVLVAGSSAFLAEPYYFASVYAGRDTFVKFYRRIYEGETISQRQMLGMIEPAEALGDVLGKIAKIAATKSEHEATVHGELEGLERFRTAEILFRDKKISREEYGSAALTYYKLQAEQRGKYQSVLMAEYEKDQADIKLNMHEIRAVLPYAHSTIKAIVKQRGYAVKQGDPVLIVQNLEKLQAEAQIEEQYFTRLPKYETATIEPTILEAPLNEFPGHALDVTSVAVAKDMSIVSGSEDRTVCVWTPKQLAPVRKMEHDDAVRVVACTPKDAKKNICLVGCANGSIYLWDLDGEGTEPIKLIKPEQAHGSDASITSLAFSPDGTQFASGASDGTIIMWTTEGGELHYKFEPKTGVAKTHEDTVTSLTFTPQCRLISAGRDKTLRVWVLKEKGAAADGKAILYREGNVPSLGVSQDGNWMLFDRGRTLQLLSVKTRTLKHTINMPANSTPFDTLALFSPNGSLILTSGTGEGRLQLWRKPEGDARGFEVRQLATRERLPVTSAAFSPDGTFAVSASGQKIYRWAIPTLKEVSEHRVEKVRMTLKSHALDSSTRMSRIGFEVINEFSARYPNGRFEAGRPVTIVIELPD
ncbi:MAG: hypothetical protein EXR98_12945 [Gemmataceae bacterium]|nr:hypothetical protein [Gemmataceae bacterium]